MTSTFCVLVGYQSGGSVTSLAYKWNGAAYSALTPSSTTSELYGVSCQSTTFCFAVGANRVSGTSVTHAEKFSGTAWSNTTTTNPVGSTLAELRSVSCPGATSCYAVGRYQTVSADLPLVQTWNGTSWTTQTVSLPAGGTNGELNDVSCTATSTCTAVGWYDASGAPRRPLIQRFSGTWANQTGVTAAGATQSELQGVACTSATSCNAVGSYMDGGTVQHQLAQLSSGTAWTLKTVPDPLAGEDSGLYDISCYTSPSAGCIAVGGFSSATAVTPTASLWNGTSWSNQTVSRATGAAETTLTGVSCPTSTTCRAVGVSLYSGTGLRPAIHVGQ